MTKKFGDLLREQRLRADKSLEEIAKELGISIAYLSDVERGRRAPFKAPRIEKVATLLGTDAAPLLEVADEERAAARSTPFPAGGDFDTLFKNFLERFQTLDAQQQKRVATILETGTAGQMTIQFTNRFSTRKRKSSSYRVEEPHVHAGKTKRQNRSGRRGAPGAVPD